MSMGLGGGQVVHEVAFFDYPSSNPAEVYSFYFQNYLKITKIAFKQQQKNNEPCLVDTNLYAQGSYYRRVKYFSFDMVVIIF